MANPMKKLENWLNDCTIKRKSFILYVFCMIIPLILTDSVVIYSVFHSEKIERQHEMENIAKSVQYTFYNTVNSSAELAKSIYMNKTIDEFLDTQYTNSLDYLTHYQSFVKSMLFRNGVGTDNTRFTMFADNDTIVNGGEFGKIDAIQNSHWYQYMIKSGDNYVLYFDYDDVGKPAVQPKRRMLFLLWMDFYDNSVFKAKKEDGTDGKQKLAVIEMDYSRMIQKLAKMSFDTPVYICWNGKIVLSNGKHSGLRKDYEIFDDYDKVGYTQNISIYGRKLKIYVLKPETRAIKEIGKNVPILIVLLGISIALPLVLVHGINRSFTVRIGELTNTMKNEDEEHLAEIESARGKDEIGRLMRNYNKMVRRINGLIQIVYKNRIKEQEMTVARQHAELSALHSQINPHFLFNALESIRMHSIIKRENETADMVEKLAIMQRQYVEWGQDTVALEKEMDFVRAYLGLQKYRFGDRLSYELDIQDECLLYEIPKLTVVTFVENACVHGIESKTAPGWIFVRIYQEAERLCIEIEDTGDSMEEKVMARLLLKMRQANIEMLKDGGRVGIINACLRLKMMTKDEVEFDLEGEKGVGTIIQIKIPLTYV